MSIFMVWRPRGSERAMASDGRPIYVCSASESGHVAPSMMDDPVYLSDDDAPRKKKKKKSKAAVAAPQKIGGLLPRKFGNHLAPFKLSLIHI